MGLVYRTLKEGYESTCWGESMFDIVRSELTCFIDLPISNLLTSRVNSRAAELLDNLLLFEIGERLNSSRTGVWERIPKDTGFGHGKDRIGSGE
jgi:hypothetical protein